MGWGSDLTDALASAGQDAMGALRSAGAAASDAAGKAASLAKSAAQATASAATQAAQATAHAAQQAASAVSSAAQQAAGAVADAAKKTAAAGLLGTEALAGAGAYGAVKGVQAAGAAYGRAKDAASAVKEAFSPHVPVAAPCLPCMAQQSAALRAARMERRQALIAQGQASADPDTNAAAARLQQDMKAVEMARLSENSYAQYAPGATPEQKKPPEPWRALDPSALEAAGMNPDQLSAAKAVVYQVPDDFPFEPKTVVAFRGTTADTEDILTDHDQALGLETAQYDAAIQVGQQTARAFPDAETTGHSLGGGKAQAAAVAGNLRGEMFNSAGLHPATMGLPADGLAGFAGDFLQYRSAGGLLAGGGDPLTGIQNSLAAQSAVYRGAQGLQGLASANQWSVDQLGLGPAIAARVPEAQKPLAGGLLDRILHVTPQQAQANHAFSDGQWYIPPAVGQVVGVPSKTADGADTPIANQHSITNLVYGIENQKAGDIDTLLAGTGNPAPATDYIGPMTSR